MRPRGSAVSPQAASLVGRIGEQQMLHAALDDAATGAPCAYLIHGEAGVGKTRLVHEVCDHTRERGFTVLWGRTTTRCSERSTSGPRTRSLPNAPACSARPPPSTSSPLERRRNAHPVPAGCSLLSTPYRRDRRQGPDHPGRGRPAMGRSGVTRCARLPHRRVPPSEVGGPGDLPGRGSRRRTLPAWVARRRSATSGGGRARTVPSEQGRDPEAASRSP